MLVNTTMLLLSCQSLKRDVEVDIEGYIVVVITRFFRFNKEVWRSVGEYRSDHIAVVLPML